MQEGVKMIAQNKKARHDYFIEDTYEAGMALKGTEIKSIRLGRINLKDSYVFIKKGELYAHGIHISPYEKGNIFNHDPLRERKLLLHKKEIAKLIGTISQKGLSLIPLKVYLKNGVAKMELGVARGKKLYDKRADAAKRDAKRDMERVMKSNDRY